MGLGAEEYEQYTSLLRAFEADGFPIFDSFCSASLVFEPGNGADHNRQRLARFKPGLGYLITHCAQGGDELAEIAPDWRVRDEERRIYSDGTMAAAMKEAGLTPIGMRELRDTFRAQLD